MDLEKKINIVKNILKDKNVAIGFSGGADSTLMAYLSSKVAKDTLAITIDNHLLPHGFVENTHNLANTFNITHEIVDINFYENEYFLSNDTARCYNCRRLMYDNIEKIAKMRGFDFICDGNNISDLIQDRPGILVTYKKGFKTPFIDAKLTSKEIHEYLNKKNIPYSRSTTCLATRIPTNTKLSKEKIEKISYCEDYILSKSQCEIVKVRYFKQNCIVEVDDIDKIIQHNQYIDINNELKKQGFEKVALNLSPIDDNDDVIIDYSEGSFSHKLPFTINLKNTKKQIKTHIINESIDNIETENMTIYENGLIEGYNFKNYEEAVDNFMDILPKLRRNI